MSPDLNATILFHTTVQYTVGVLLCDVGKIWMEAVGQEAREGLNTELDLEKPAQPTCGTFFATCGTFGNLWHFLAQV